MSVICHEGVTTTTGCCSMSLWYGSIRKRKKKSRYVFGHIIKLTQRKFHRSLTLWPWQHSEIQPQCKLTLYNHYGFLPENNKLALLTSLCAFRQARITLLSQCTHCPMHNLNLNSQLAGLLQLSWEWLLHSLSLVCSCICLFCFPLDLTPVQRWIISKHTP